MIRLDPESLLQAYCNGAFPMTDPDGQTRWYTADPRGIIPLDAFHIPQTLGRLVRQKRFEIRFNHDFEATMRACMTARSDATWISDELVAAYVRLHMLGHAHSVEAWRANRLVGGLYGVSVGAAFFGESMFHTERDASKVALVALVERLRERGFELLDTQATTTHLERFGCVQIPAAEYLARLDRAIAKDVRFD